MTSTPPAQYSNISIPQEQQQQEQYHQPNYHNHHRQHYQKQHYSMLDQNKEGAAATAEDRKVNPAAIKEKRANHNTPLPTTTRKEIIIHKKLANIGHTTTTSVEKFQQTTTHHHHHHSEHTTTSSSDNHNSGDEMQCSSSNNNSGSAEVSGAHTSGTMSTVTTITFEDIAKYFDLKLEGKLLSFFFRVFVVFVVSC